MLWELKHRARLLEGQLVSHCICPIWSSRVPWIKQCHLFSAAVPALRNEVLPPHTHTHRDFNGPHPTGISKGPERLGFSPRPLEWLKPPFLLFLCSHLGFLSLPSLFFLFHSNAFNILSKDAVNCVAYIITMLGHSASQMFRPGLALLSTYWVLAKCLW